MEYEQRGKIAHRERARQIIDFSGLRYGNITPTDIDGLIEYHDKAYILMEFKYKNAEVPAGQMLAYKRLANDLQKAGKPTVLLICRHDVENPEQDIDAASAMVTEYWYAGKPYYDVNRTVADVCESFLAYVDKKPF